MRSILSLLLIAACAIVIFGSQYDYDNVDGNKDVYNEEYPAEYGNDYTYDYKDYSPSRGRQRNRGYGDGYNYRPQMNSYEKSYSPKKPQKQKVFVPVVIKKKNKKKTKIIAVHTGFYIPGGTQMFGKFKDLFSCKKACEITPTCFSGDFNPWLGKCYLHSNLTACGNMRSHKAITHFTKVPCSILETTRGFVALGVSTINGIEIKGIDTLSDCIKKCATAGGGVVAKDSMIVTGGQVCCHIDYDFASHKCYFHPCVNPTLAPLLFCTAVAIITTPPLNSIANPTSVSITICPLSS